MVRSTAQFVLPRGFRVWRLLAIVALIGAALAVSTDHSQAEAPVDVVTTDTSFTLSWSADGEVKFYWWQPIARKLERVTVSDAKSWTATGLQPESEHEFSFFGAFYGSLKFKTKASGDPPPPPTPPPPPPPPPTPEVSIAAGTDITEGGTASFTLTANPAPTSSITVSVSPSQSGDFGVGSAAKTVTITTSGTATATFSTTNDSVDEADGSVTATIDSGNGYTVSSSKGSATLAVTDDDLPELSIASDGDVTEGTAASFTITASPTPHTALTANIDITATGSFGVTTGAQTVAISTSGSQSFTVSTSGDTTDEPNGTVTATLSTGSGYNVSSSAGTATATVSDDDDPPPPPTDPVVSIVAGSDITEGSDASFTVTITPEPSEKMTVHVTVTQSGDFLPKDKRDVLIYVVFSMSSPHTFTVATTDDSTDEPDGSFTATITDREGYTVSTTNGVATVAVSDNDDPPAQPDADTDSDTESDTTSATCELPDDAITADEVTGWRDALDPNKAAAGITRWNRILEALGVDTGTGVSAMTADQAQNVADWLGNTRWDRTSRTLAAQDACDTEPPPPPPPPPPPDPEISISSSSDINEGGTVTFTLTATPAPTADVAVSVSVTQSGSYTSQAGARTVTITSTGTASFTVTTLDDSSDEPDGSLTATVNTGTGYTVSSSAGATTANVADNDDPPLPEISISGGSAVAEGSNVSFTVTATPAPTAALDVSVTVTQSGSFTTQTGAQTVTILATGSASFTISTDNDATDEPDGSVTATIDTGTGYTVSSSAGSTTVNVTDDDDTPKPAQQATPTITIADASADEGDMITFTVSVSPTHTADITVDYETVDGTAISHADVDDYSAASGSVTIAANTSSATFVVNTTEDDDIEIDDQFTVNLSNPSYGAISDGTATGTITNDDTGETGKEAWTTVDGKRLRYIPTLSRGDGKQIVSQSMMELSEATKWSVRLRHQPPTTVTVVPYLKNEKDILVAILPEQYLVFNTENWATYQKFSIKVAPDFNSVSGKIVVDYDIIEFDNELVNDVGWIAVLDQVSGRIVQEKPNTTGMQEGDTTASVTYQLKLVDVPLEPIIVTLTNPDPGAVQLSTTSLTFTSENYKQFQEVTITPVADSDGDDEQVTITVNIPVPGAHGPRIETFSVTVLDDDVAPQPAQQATPTITIADASADEGDTMTFTVSVSPTHPADITVDYETVDGTAISHPDVNDYTAASGSVTIAANASSATFVVNTIEDDHTEIDDQFTIVLSTTQTDVMIENSTATGTIVNDDTGTAGNALRQCLEWKKDTPWPGECLRWRLFVKIHNTYLANIGKDMNNEDKYYWGSRIVIEDFYEPHEFGMYLDRKPDTTLTIVPFIKNPLLVPFVPITPRYLVFTPENYSVPQKVSLHMLPDFNTRAEVSDLTARVVEFPSAFVYGLYRQRNLWFFDRRRKPIEQELPATRVLQESETSTSLTYRLRLGARPTAGEDIVVTIKASPDKVNLSAATLTYTHDTWDVWQEVTITPKVDADSDDEQVKVTVHIPVPGPDGPGPGHGPRIETFSLTVLDDDP